MNLGVLVDMTQIPKRWADAMMACGFTHRGEPSMSALARDAGLSVETVRRMVHGTGNPDPENVAKVKSSLRGAPVDEWVGLAEIKEIYVGPSSSRMLSARQRVALTELINSMTASELSELTSSAPLASVTPLRKPPTAEELERMAAREGDAAPVFGDPENQDDGSWEPA